MSPQKPKNSGSILNSAFENLSTNNETALLGALLNRGRPVWRLPKFDQLTPAHFTDPIHATLLILYRQDKTFAQSYNLQKRTEILKSQPAFETIPDHRTFLENLMRSENDPATALRALLQAGPIKPEHSSIQILVPPRNRQLESPSFQNNQSKLNQPTTPMNPPQFATSNAKSAFIKSPTLENNSEFSILNSPFEGPIPGKLPDSHSPLPTQNSHFPAPLGQPPTANFQLKRRKRRADSVFAQLSDEDHHRLQKWLHQNSYEKVVEMVAKPAPEGFGIKTHITSLHRYFYATAHDELLTIREDIGADFQDLAALCQADPIAYRVIMRENLERHLMLLSADPKPNLPLILRLLRALQREQEFEFKKSQAQTRSEKTQKPKTNTTFPLAAMNELGKSLTPAPQPTGRHPASQASVNAPVPLAPKACMPVHALSQSETILHTNSHSVLTTPACNGN